MLVRGLGSLLPGGPEEIGIEPKVDFNQSSYAVGDTMKIDVFAPGFTGINIVFDKKYTFPATLTGERSWTWSKVINQAGSRLVEVKGQDGTVLASVPVDVRPGVIGENGQSESYRQAMEDKDNTVRNAAVFGLALGAIALYMLTGRKRSAE